MSFQAKFDIDLTVRSFAYVAAQLAQSRQYEQIPREAEKHCSALRLVQRDVFELAEQQLRQNAVTNAEFQRTRALAARAIAQAQRMIARVAARYAPQKLAA